MSGLSFICEYSSSDSESESKFETSKRPRLPAPDLSKVSVVPIDAHVDDPLQHEGRIRSFPHVRGNWATYAYIKYSEENSLLNVIEILERTLLVQNGSWRRCSDFHISLSKIFTLPYHLITPFTSNLQEAVSDTESFTLEFSGVKVYCNEENTRTFIALAVDQSCHRNLLTLTQKVDEMITEFKLPKFYEDPSFHMSIFWIAGDKKIEVNNILNELNNLFSGDTENQKTGIVDRVFCKSGNKFFQYSLL